MNMYEISKKNFLTDKRSILFYTALMPDRYRSAANMHANGIYPHEEYFFGEGRKGQFLPWWKKSDSNAVVCELEIIYVNIYIFSLARRNSSGLFRTQTREDRFDRWW